MNFFHGLYPYYWIPENARDSRHDMFWGSHNMVIITEILDRFMQYNYDYIDYYIEHDGSTGFVLETLTEKAESDINRD